MKKILVAAFLPVFFLIVFVVGTYFFAKLGVSMAINKVKVKRTKAVAAKALLKKQVSY